MSQLCDGARRQSRVFLESDSSGSSQEDTPPTEDEPTAAATICATVQTEFSDLGAPSKINHALISQEEFDRM